MEEIVSNGCRPTGIKQNAEHASIEIAFETFREDGVQDILICGHALANVVVVVRFAFAVFECTGG